MPVKLTKGMVFAVCSDSMFARCINAVQKVKAVDNEAIYNHAGIIVSEKGRTFEALSKIRYSDLDGYKGSKILIAHYKSMTDEMFNRAWPEIDKLNGSIYPFPRLVLHLVGLAKFVHWKFPVCSELVAKFEFEAGIRKNWWGIMPDNLADEWQMSKHYEIVYDGIYGTNDE